VEVVWSGGGGGRPGQLKVHHGPDPEKLCVGREVESKGTGLEEGFGLVV